MDDVARWTVEVPRDTDLAVRELVGDDTRAVSAFVDKAVTRQLLALEIERTRQANADRDSDEIDRLIEAELAIVRREMREAGRYQLDPQP
ncbi:ribbon-helix-helix domain-containing protein [Sandaracinobacteroides saxicola]|uniref:XACb0070 ribbon-helix-helix domain-containing protein n=1 Tax=Sandaracinobacteroides saxicola TaxID=2759707 RepID=A0A7G5IID0_9SPHN|nr:ribbon-helix-helix domain-containing protein [Sandaracinobacteroides saxicola]QMW23122.1 hypothetical protein H3309_00980 [Sandaracinobacteroides saxicola]